ncbi:MAG: hypothetical protein FJ271_13190 [Planctomycetes bacterium]|nr:hypothetical protein [Planctomycetota bacterium]
MIDKELVRLEQLVDDARRSLAQARLEAKVISAEGADVFQVQLCLPHDRKFCLPDGVIAYCWPITLPEGSAVTVKPGSGIVAEFSRLSFGGLTSFFAFNLAIADGERKVSARFVLNLPLDGAPVDRRERILQSLLSNRAEVLRFLLLLLAEAGTDAAGILRIPTPFQQGESGNGPGSMGVPLFETMVRALDRQPEKLEQVARLVDDLQKTPGSKDLLPEGFELVWQPIWNAYKRMKS